MTATRQYNIVWYPYFFISDVSVYKKMTETILYYVVWHPLFFMNTYNTYKNDGEQKKFY